MYTIIVNTPGPQGPTGPSGSVNTGSLVTTGSNVFIGDQIITGSATISNLLVLTPQDPLPISPPTGALAISSSVPPRLYLYDGSAWNML